MKTTRLQDIGSLEEVTVSVFSRGLQEGPDWLARMLAVNRVILLGDKSPDKVSIMKNHSSYLAVVSVSHPSIEHSELLYENEKYKLHRLIGAD